MNYSEVFCCMVHSQGICANEALITDSRRRILATSIILHVQEQFSFVIRDCPFHSQWAWFSLMQQRQWGKGKELPNSSRKNDEITLADVQRMNKWSLDSYQQRKQIEESKISFLFGFFFWEIIHKIFCRKPSTNRKHLLLVGLMKSKPFQKENEFRVVTCKQGDVELSQKSKEM